MGTLPAPRLLSPGEEVKLSGDDLEFRWTSEGGRSDRDYYDFRLYKGPSTFGSALLLKEKVPPGNPSWKVKADVFESGQLYAWSVRQVGMRKSRSNYAVFKVTQKISK